MLDTLQLVPALRARWRLALSVWLAIVVAALAVTYLLPPRYEATATLIVEMGGADPIRPEVFKPAGAVSTYLATQVDVIKSEQVARGALRSLGLEKDPAWIEKWRRATDGEGDFESWLSGVLLRKLAVRPSRDSNALNLSFTSPDREFSAAVANAFVKSYVDATLQMRAAPARQFNTFFEERAKPLRQALEDSKARLSAYEQKNGLIVGDQQDADVESARLGELTAQLVALQDEATAAANRQRQAMSGPGGMQEVRTDPEVSGLMAELAREEAGLTKLKSNFGDRHPEVVQAQKAITDLRQRLASGMKRAAATLGVPVKANQARLAEVRAAIERQRAVVMRRQSQRNAAAALLRDVDNAQKAYDAVLSRASQTALEAANTTQASIAVVKSATPPALASSLLVINLSAAMLLGALLGIASALFREGRDRRLRTVQDVTRLLQQPLLLALPDGYARHGDATRRSVETQRRLVAVKPRLFGPR